MGSVAIIAVHSDYYNYSPLNGDTLIPTFTIEFLLEYTGRSSLILIANPY
jgi:hypothetical protein